MNTLTESQLTQLNLHAADFLNTPSSFVFTELEQSFLRPFFTNLNGRVCVMHSLPAAITSVLSAMYSRMKDPRSMRGTFLSFVLSIVATDTIKYCEGKWETPELFLKEIGITTLDDFKKHSPDTHNAVVRFEKNMLQGNPDYLEHFANAERAKKFMARNRDKYGHNSIARMGTITIIFEGVSILSAKAIEWTRPSTGYVELSTRYVDMKLAERFPISSLLQSIGENGQKVEEYQLRCFKLYSSLLGTKLDGPFPAFLRQQYSPLFTKLGRKDVEAGIGGESYDVLGCLLPASTLTSLACTISGEALPQLLKHLLLEDTPEFTGLVPLIMQELAKVGGDQFVRHFKPTPHEQHNWRALAIFPFQEIEKRGENDRDLTPYRRVAKEELLKAFQAKEGFEHIQNLDDLAVRLSEASRGAHDKLPSEFESYTHSGEGVMSFRGWRDLHRQQLSTHNRTHLTPDLGFYTYDKPAPLELEAAFLEVEEAGRELYNTLRHLPARFLEHILPLGFKIGYTYGANLRQHEFCNWQRTNPNVNHEVRSAFLNIDRSLLTLLPEWLLFSRADREPAYLFARFDDKKGPIVLDEAIRSATP